MGDRRQRWSLRTARCLHLAVLLCAAPDATAGNFRFQPVRLERAAGQRAGSLSLSNTGSKPVVIEVKAFAWSQVDGVDQLTPTDDLVLTPPLVNIAGNSNQLIRVGRRAQVKAGSVERTYRIAIQEVVPAEEAAKPGIHFALRLSVPVFIAPALGEDAVARPRAQWSIARADKGGYAVRLRNSGDMHLQVLSFEVRDGGDKLVARHQEMAYVLAGQERRFVLKPSGVTAAPGTTLSIRANTDAGDQAARVTLNKP